MDYGRTDGEKDNEAREGLSWEEGEDSRGRISGTLGSRGNVEERKAEGDTGSIDLTCGSRIWGRGLRRGGIGL